MESNIKGLVAAGHEMASELKAECGAVDMRSVAKLISDLATQLEVQLVRANALAAENAGLKSAHPQPFGPEMMKALDAYEKHQDEVPETGMLNAFFILRDSIRVETPATDAFLSEAVGKLRVELEEAKSKLNEQREYYEGVISDGSKRIAELEKSEEQLINERDHAESALDDMYFAATGNRPEWSNWFGFSDAVDAVVDRIADLEAKQCIEEMSKQSCEARERDLFESWVMHSICISKSTLEGLRTETGYRNATLSGTGFNRMWEQWKSIRAAGIRIKGD
ncbi:TPA: ead/Ea22-like family protein [Escherichia coli]|nr:ead/Ea22-like family protein [Escherichia coli]